MLTTKSKSDSTEFTDNNGFDAADLVVVSPESTLSHHSSITADNSLPDHPYFDTNYQTTLQQSKMLCWLIEDQLKDTHDQSLESLVKLAHDISTSDQRTMRMIAVLGDSGVGKSTLLNSLLDCPGIAQQGGSGEAVTSVPTEYRFLEGKSTGYCLEVEYQTEHEIKQTIREYVWNSQCLQLPDVNEKVLSGEEYQTLERKTNVANAALSVIFGDHEDLESLCVRRDEHSFESAVQTLVQWSDDLEWPSGCEDGKMHYSTDNAEDCADRLSEFTSGNLWPLLKIARIYLKSPLLQHGIVLVDLPGLRDTNAARVKTTQEHLAKVDHVFLLANITRAASNESVTNGIFNILKRNIPNKFEETDTDYRGLTVVCTKSEDMDFAEMEKDFVKRRKMIAKQEIDELMLKERSAKLTQDHKSYEKALRHRFMEVRNAFVTSRVQAAYRAGKGHKDLKIFCVSSKEYNEGRSRKDNKQIIISQIPALRQYCFQIVADQQLVEAQNFLMFALPGLLQSIQLYTAPKPKADQALLETLSTTKELFLSIQDSIEDEFGLTPEISATTLMTMMLESMKRLSKWTKAAKNTHQEYEGWHWASYDAFVRNNGTHSSGVQGHRQWNNEMSAKMRADLSRSWESVESLVENRITELSKITNKKLTKLSRDSKKLSDFSRTVKLWVPIFESELYKIQFSTVSKLRFIESKINEDNYASFMYGAMLPAYREAAGICGRGKNRAQIARITSQLQADMFSRIVRKINSKTEKVLSEMDDDLQALCQNCFNKLDGDLNAIQRRAAETSSKVPVKDYSTLRLMLKEWNVESEKGLVLARKVEEEMKGSKVLVIR